jgi:hypothetical protein
MGALARVGPIQAGLHRSDQVRCFAHQRGLGEAEQKTCLHQRRHHPRRIGLGCGIQGLDRRPVEGHHLPQRMVSLVQGER